MWILGKTGCPLFLAMLWLRQPVRGGANRPIGPKDLASQVRSDYRRAVTRIWDFVEQGFGWVGHFALARSAFTNALMR